MIFGFKKRLFVAAGVLLGATVAQAAAPPPIPGSADVGRVNPLPSAPVPDRRHDQDVTVPVAPPAVIEAPEAALKTSVTLQNVTIEGVSVFSQEEIEGFVAPYLGRRVSVSALWDMAAQLTARYRARGYFLSRVYVPQQKIHGGKAVLRAVEGYIGEVNVSEDPALAKNPFIRMWIARLTKMQPLTAQALESALLELNDLPGVSFRAVLAPVKNKAENNDADAVALTLVPSPKKESAVIGADNFGSRYLGPQEASLSWQGALTPTQGLSISVLSSLPPAAMKGVSLAHNTAFAPGWTATVSTALTRAAPGYTLKPLAVSSFSAAVGAGVTWQALRQRDKNAALRLGLDARNVSSDIFGGPQVRDRVRALRFSATGDLADSWRGYSTFSVTVSQGLTLLSPDKVSDPYLSRPLAAPGFTKAEASVSRLMPLTEDWSLLASAAGQFSNDVLYASEEFGYGGQAYGRAYDSSEISGDKGAAGAVELRYAAWSRKSERLAVTPYAFYDIGKVWSTVPNTRPLSGASAGAGLRFTTLHDFSGNAGFAVPLTKPADTPVYDGAGHDARFYMQILKSF